MIAPIRWSPPSQLRPGGMCRLGWPELRPEHAEAEEAARPPALLVEGSWWGAYAAEFGDKSLLQVDYRIRGIKENDGLSNCVVALVFNKSDAEMLRRTYWLCNRRAFHSWVDQPTLTRLRMAAADVTNKEVRFSN